MTLGSKSSLKHEWARTAKAGGSASHQGATFVEKFVVAERQRAIPAKTAIILISFGSAPVCSVKTVHDYLKRTRGSHVESALRIRAVACDQPSQFPR